MQGGRKGNYRNLVMVLQHVLGSSIQPASKEKYFIEKGRRGKKMPTKISSRMK